MEGIQPIRRPDFVTCDTVGTVAMFLLRNDQETVIIVNTSESSLSNSGIILGLRKV